jgi:hypothetical protein
MNKIIHLRSLLVCGAVALVAGLAANVQATPTRTHISNPGSNSPDTISVTQPNPVLSTTSHHGRGFLPTRSPAPIIPGVPPTTVLSDNPAPPVPPVTVSLNSVPDGGVTGIMFGAVVSGLVFLKRKLKA